MSLQHSPEGRTDRKILLAVAGAIRLIESATDNCTEYDISKDDAELLCSATGDLWAILETNGYTIDIDTNRLRKVKP